MRNRMLKWLAAGLCGMLAACAIITVNVYFPEKDVKQAYKSLDEMLLKQGQDQQATPPAAGEEKLPETKPEEVKPQSMFHGVRFTFSLAGEAYAAENIADALAIELSSMPDVLKAYEEMNARLAQLDTLRDSGAVGENSQGLVAVRDPAKLGDKQSLVKAENDNRKTVITGMARAILKINKQAVTAATINQVLPKAAATYADTRRDAARHGWWLQLANGRWVQK
jgi:uncharacterized protein DUF1318